MQEKFRRRHLPHWDLPGATYFITACLEGSIPAEGLRDIVEYQRQLERREKPANLSALEWKTLCWKWNFARRDKWLDQALAVRHFADPAVAKIAVDAMYFFAGQRYDLLSYVVMPSHIHWVFQPREEWVTTLTDIEERSPRERIMHSLKLHAALKCNELLGRSGTVWDSQAFWQDESYDHCVVDEQGVFDADELERIIYYIEQNPVKARLIGAPELWEFSSAYDRLRFGIPLGRPLIRPK